MLQDAKAKLLARRIVVEAQLSRLIEEKVRFEQEIGRLYGELSDIDGSIQAMNRIENDTKPTFVI